MKIIAVANQKGGCGKTITAVNIAGALAMSKKKVLFIDLDPQAHATQAFGISMAETKRSSYSIFEAFLNNDNLNFLSLPHQKSDNLWVINSNLSLSTMELKMSGIKNAILVLQKTLKSQANAPYDYVILDTPPNLGFLTLNAIHAADKIVVPIDVSLFSLHGVDHITEILSLSKSMGFETPELRYLITLFDGRTNFAKNFLEKVKARFGQNLFQTMIRPNIKLREAVQSGRNIFEYDANSNGAKDYASLARELFPELKDQTIKPARKIFDRPVSRLIETQFKLFAPEAGSVHIAGSFNNWSVNDSSKMKKLDDGSWVKLIPLSEGTYTYKFVSDGKWIEDPSNQAKLINDFGSSDSCVEIRREMLVS